MISPQPLSKSQSVRRHCRILVLALLLGLRPATTYATKIQYGFSPEGSAESLVIKVIDSSKQDIRMMCYSFTSPQIVTALINAKHRGVNIAIVADKNGNRGKNSRAAMNLVVHAGIALRLDSAYKIQHDKVIVVDGKTVETGSFNYTASAANSNSENVLVAWDDPSIAEGYLDHWLSRWRRAKAYRSAD